MKKFPLKHAYRLDKAKVLFRRPEDWAKQGGVRAYSAWPIEEREICQACDKYIAHIRDNPPHVTGWLSKGIDKTRMLRVKREMEEIERDR